MIVGSLIRSNSNKPSLIISLLVSINTLAIEEPHFFNKFIHQLQSNEQVRERINVRTMIEKIFEFDANRIKEQLFKLLEENHELDYIL